jgi:hypothetical protein
LKNTWIILVALAIFSCTAPEQAKSPFSHEINVAQKPWNSETFEATEEDFTFGIIADLTGGERPGIFSVAVEQLNQLEPTFVLSVGDLIEGGTKDLAQLEQEWESFDGRANRLQMPFFHIGGNHDLSNLVMQDFWKSRYGELYYYFIYDDVLFLMLDSEDFDEATLDKIDRYRADAMKIIYGEIEGDFDTTRYFHLPERITGAISKDQVNYFADVLDRHRDVRWTFVFMHKPVWKRDDDMGLKPIEELLKERKYTVINGHEHSFSYQQRNEQDYLMLGTTGGFQAPDNQQAFDHITLVRMAEEPVITHLRLDGILDKTGHIPNGGDTLNFQASKSNNQ